MCECVCNMPWCNLCDNIKNIVSKSALFLIEYTRCFKAHSMRLNTYYIRMSTDECQLGMKPYHRGGSIDHPIKLFFLELPEKGLNTSTHLVNVTIHLTAAQISLLRISSGPSKLRFHINFFRGTMDCRF